MESEKQEASFLFWPKPASRREARQAARKSCTSVDLPTAKYFILTTTSLAPSAYIYTTYIPINILLMIARYLLIQASKVSIRYLAMPPS